MNEFITIGPKMRKLMLRDMHTEVEGKTECIEHDYSKEVLNLDKGRFDTECSNCGEIKPLDPIDNNTVEVD
mgnify:CR=1 FL=1